MSLRNMNEVGKPNVQEFSQRSPRSQMEITIIKNLISSYFNVVRKNLNDIVPKTVIAMLVNKTKNQAQRDQPKPTERETNASARELSLSQTGYGRIIQ